MHVQLADTIIAHMVIAKIKEGFQPVMRLGTSFYYQR
jgi:hypothetical protein